jgi:hypothetical protein
MATPTEALQLLATYKYFQAEFYRRGLLAFAAGPDAFSPGQRAVVGQLAKQTAAHVSVLQTALGGSAPAQPAPDTTYDYSAAIPGNPAPGPFAGALGPTGLAPYTGASRPEFFKLVQLLADFEVRAIKGQLPDLMADRAKMQIALQIHAVAGRHAAESRMMRGSGTARNMVTFSTTAFQTGIAFFVDRAGSTIFDAGSASAPNGYVGAVTDPTTQGYMATLVYGSITTGPAANTTPTDSESNPIQRGYGPAGADAFDEPVSAEAVTTFLARFNAA